MGIIKKINNFCRSRFKTFQGSFVLIGCIVGLPLAILLLLTGIAAIPFTGGASLLPAWMAIALYLVIVTGSFASAGNYIGLSIDSLVKKEPLTNAKIATIAGCTIGVALSIVAIPLHLVGVRFIVERAAISIWKFFVYFVPLTIGAFGSACSYIGRSIDTLTRDKTIFSLFKKNSPVPDESRPHSVAGTPSTRMNTKQIESSPAVTMRLLGAQASANHSDSDKEEQKKEDIKKKSAGVITNRRGLGLFGCLRGQPQEKTFAVHQLALKLE